jgi:hypothetical protein
VVSVAGVFMAAAPGNWQGAAALVSSEDPAPCCALATPPRNSAKVARNIHWYVRIMTSEKTAHPRGHACIDELSPNKF